MITRDLFKFHFKILLKLFLEESTFKYQFKTRNQVISPFRFHSETSLKEQLKYS